MLLGVNNQELRRLQSGDCLYTEKDIPKRNGKGTRHIENPARPLKLAQARIAKLLMRVAPPEFLFCPVKGRSYVDNAARHSNAIQVRCVDIQNFFPSVSSRRVFWFYHEVMACTRDIAGMLTKVSTYKEHLPTGSPLSPILAYFAYFDMWEKVSAICCERGLTLSVYIDDCTISGKYVSGKDIFDVKQIIYGYGLRYHKEKSYNGNFSEITGVVCRNGGLYVPNRQLLKLKIEKRSALKLGALAPAETISTIRGLETQAQHVAKISRINTR